MRYKIITIAADETIDIIRDGHHIIEDESTFHYGGPLQLCTMYSYKDREWIAVRLPDTRYQSRYTRAELISLDRPDIFYDDKEHFHRGKEYIGELCKKLIE
jgi:hypothetical protein